MFINGISILGVILSGIASMVLGFFWYSRILFAKPWMEENGFKDEDLDPQPARYIVTLILALTSAVMMNILINITGWSSTFKSALLGLMIGLGLVATTFGTSYLFENKRLRLFLINAGYQVIYLIAAAMIISVFV